VRRRRNKQQSTETCYMCDKPATTREHSPPIGFFPDSRRVNLITVPSCKTHNNDNSFNVEYTRNIIVTDIHTTDIAREMFAEKVLPSYRRGHKLRRLTFQKYREVKIGGLDSAIVHLHESRFNPVMRAIANALFFHDYGEKYQYRWMIYRATMLSDGQAFHDMVDNINPQIRAFLRSIKVQGRATNQPEVFNYGGYRGIDHRVIYKLIFYGGVDVYTIGIPNDSDVW
jgi:hypothetical protein